MPEGDTIHKLARYLRPRLVGARAHRIEVGFRDTTPVAEQRITAVEAHGKHLLIHFANEWLLRSHLGMYGSWHRYDFGERWKRPERQASVILETDDEVFVCFNAKEVQIARSRSIGERSLLSRLGPDLLGEDFDAIEAVRRVRKLLEPDTPMVDVLLDQRVACGIGNVYKSELLFLLCIHPLTPLESIDDGALADLFLLARELLGRNLGGGPRTTRFEADGPGALWVYRRRGLPCLRCETPLLYTRMGRHMRSTYWCPECQPAPET